MNALRDRLSQARDQGVRLKQSRDNLESTLREVEAEIASSSTQIDLLVKVSELLKELLDRMVTEQVHAIESVVTDGFRAIFQDQDLSFKATVGYRYNKVAIDFLVQQGASGEGPVIEGPPLDAFGGGPASIASLVLRLMALVRLKKWPVLLLDETLAAVSDEYLDQTGMLLRRLAETTGVDVLLVTHKPALIDHAHVAYQGYEQQHHGGWSLGLTQTKKAHNHGA